MKKIKISLVIIIMFLFVININKINAVEELPDDGGKISSSQVIQTKTGTGPFDENDEPGNDSSEDNNVVRSFDQVTWTVENTMVLNGNEADSYSGGRIYFEAVLPDVFTSETAKWDVDSMGWVQDAQVSNDGLKLTGYYQMSSDNITVPGKQTLIFIAKIEGAANGIEFQPTIKTWLNGNSESEHQTVIPEKTIISAAPKYNIQLVKNGYWDQRVTVDFGNGNETGRMYSYGFTVQLRNENASKGLKGIEFPKGNITFDIKLKMEKSGLGSTEVLDITNESNIKLWNYNINIQGTTGKIPGRTMIFSGIDHSRFCYDIPRGRTSTISMQTSKNGVFDSGDLEMTQIDESTIKVTVKDYKFNGLYPIYNAANTPVSIGYQYGNNVGCFVADQFQIFVPDNEANLDTNSNYYLTVADENMNVTSMSGEIVSNQQYTSDDTKRISHVIYKDGIYNDI